MNQIIIGNILGLIASTILVCIGLIKNKKRIIYIQTIQICITMISNLILGGISGAITNILSCIRNLLYNKNKLDIKAKLIIIVLSTYLTIKFNTNGFIGFLPLISTITYTLLMDTKDILEYKILAIYTTFLWCIYNFYIKSYVSVMFYMFHIATNSIAIIQIVMNNNKKLNLITNNNNEEVDVSC